MPRGHDHDPMYPLSIYARFSGQFFFKFSLKKIVMGKKKIVVPCLEVKMRASSLEIYSKVLFLPERRSSLQKRAH